ncbi:unnamed protein product [Brassica rapa]|uniref:Uncharacterized protein n=1 Tax=Brassica campestris TaxID=3711 RepID=A0A3P5YLB6_BRACM|nr:unnamed protein product [Brassica rapa]VDC67899.1 unnamed protein product [Brassica rapa]
MTILPLGSCNATYSLFNFETTYTLFLMRHQNRYNTHLSPSIFHRSFFWEFFVFSVENYFQRFLIPIYDHRKPNSESQLLITSFDDFMFPTGDQMADTFFHLGSLPLEMNPMV